MSIDRTDFLTHAEVEALTGKKYRPAQCRELVTLGIMYRERRDGSPVVLRAHAEEVLTGRPARRQPKRVEPDWDAVRR